MNKILVCSLLLCAVNAMQGSTKSYTLTTIKLEPYLGAQLAIHAEVNGHAGLFLFDTGEGVSTISPQFANSIGCRPWGRITGFRMTGGRRDIPRCDNLQLKTAGESLTTPIAGVFDIMSPLPADAPHLDGSLGLDIFAGWAITFDESSQLLIMT
jgi:hypothetical protein